MPGERERTEPSFLPSIRSREDSGAPRSVDEETTAKLGARNRSDLYRIPRTADSGDGVGQNAHSARDGRFPEKPVERPSPYEKRALPIGDVLPRSPPLHLAPIDEVRRRSLDHDFWRQIDSERRENDANARGKTLTDVLPLSLAQVEEENVVAVLREAKSAARPRGSATRDENVGVDPSSQVQDLQKRR
jgi:hypothetical protein